MLPTYANKLILILTNKKGQGLVEYGFIISLIAIATIATLGLLGGQLLDFFNSLVDKFVPAS